MQHQRGNRDVWIPSDAIYSAAHSRLMAQASKHRMLLLMRSVRGEEGDPGIERGLKHMWRARRKREPQMRAAMGRKAGAVTAVEKMESFVSGNNDVAATKMLL